MSPPHAKSPPYDTVIRGGTVVTATDSMKADVAISGETIVAIGRELPRARARSTRRGGWCCRAASTPTAISSSCPRPAS